MDMAMCDVLIKNASQYGVRCHRNMLTCMFSVEHDIRDTCFFFLQVAAKRTANGRATKANGVLAVLERW